jgi:SAM-dependent methyltransferase
MPAPAAARQPERSSGGWFATPLAQRLLREEQRFAIPLLTGCFGKSGLYVRCGEAAPAELSGNMLQTVLRLYRDGAHLAGDLRCADASLPLLRESIDLVYLLHAIETCPEPLELLMEIERAMAPEGTLLLVGLNPYSLWRMCWNGLRRPVPGAGRVRALLRESGFEVVQQRGVGPILPWLREQPWIAGPDVGQRDLLSVWRAAYLIQARKRRRGMTPVRPRAGAVAFQAGMRPG